MYHSLRITPTFIKDFDEIIKHIRNWYKLPENFRTPCIVVKEVEANEHYHILIKTEIPITTIRSKIKKMDTENNKSYCLKKQKEDDANLDKAYRYLYKGKDANTLPDVIHTFHSKKAIQQYHKRYWDIHQEVVENSTMTNIQKAYKYMALTYQHKLTTLTDAQIAAEITYNKVSKGLPPLPTHTLRSYIQFIRFKAEEEFGGEDLKKSILQYFTDQFTM